MTLTDFQKSIKNQTKPIGIVADLEALWEDAVGHWGQAHEIAQNPNTPNGDRIHAYLHRKEGDLFNANYWYQRCGMQMPNVSLDEEWQSLVQSYL